MDGPRTCPTCGNAIPADAPGGSCPRCLLAAGFGSGEEGAKAAAAPSPEDMGRHFPALEILEVLGQGGMGIVYRAKQRNLDRVVALKVLTPEIAREAGFADRFTREARTLARLQHPNIVGVHDFGTSDGLYYLLMEYVDGPNLRQVIREGKLSPREALAIVPQVCDALQYAHDHGVVHRDIKPENILLDRAGRVRIADFGLAKVLQRTPVDLTLTRAGQVMGTLHYMAPEQYRTPDSVDHRADIYSLGVVFYEMLTGELPLGAFPRPSERSSVDARLDGVVMRALERERERRWQSASDVKTAVSAVSDGSAPPPADAAPAAGPSGPAKVVEGPGFRVEKGPGGSRVEVPGVTVETGPGGRDVRVSGPAFEGAAPGAPAAPFPRLSRLAVAGGLAVPASLVAALLGFGLGMLVTWGDDYVAAWTSASLAFAVLFGGWIASVVAWARIRHSGGALEGKAWAVVGTFLAPAFVCCGGPALFILSPGTLVHVEDGPDGSRVRIPFLSVEDRGGSQRIRMPGLEVTVEDRPDEAKVVGAPAGTIPGVLVAEMESLWIQSTLPGNLGPDTVERAARLSPADRARYLAMTPEDRARARGLRRLGLLLDAEAEFGRAPSALRMAWVALEEGAERGRVVRTDGRVTVSYPVVREGNRWYPALGQVETADRGPAPGDRTGWLRPVQGEGKDPAERVSAVGAMDDLAKAALAGEALRLWDRGGGAVLSHVISKRISNVVDMPPSAYGLYHAFVAEGGASARMVFAEGRSTVAVPARKSEGGWAFDLAGTVEFRHAPATPEDRDGWLGK